MLTLLLDDSPLETKVQVLPLTRWYFYGSLHIFLHPANTVSVLCYIYIEIIIVPKRLSQWKF